MHGCSSWRAVRGPVPGSPRARAAEAVAVGPAAQQPPVARSMSWPFGLFAPLDCRPGPDEDEEAGCRGHRRPADHPRTPRGGVSRPAAVANASIRRRSASSFAGTSVAATIARRPAVIRRSTSKRAAHAAHSAMWRRTDDSASPSGTAPRARSTRSASRCWQFMTRILRVRARPTEPSVFAEPDVPGHPRRLPPGRPPRSPRSALPSTWTPAGPARGGGAT